MTPATSATSSVPSPNSGALFRVFSWCLAHREFSLLMVLTLILQGYFYSVSVPNQFPDSNVYLQTATALRDGDWNYAHFAYRTPGYPLFLALGQILFGEKGFTGMMAMQFLLGVLFPGILYALFRLWTDRRWIAAVAAMAFFADRFTVGSQTVLLTEWLSAWMGVTSLVVFLYAQRIGSLKAAAFAGIALGMCIFVRPSFSFLPVCLAVGTIGVTALYPHLRPNLRRVAIWNGSVVAVAWLVTLPWRIVLWSNFGSLALSFILGVSLSNHMGPIMEKASDQHKEIRDLYVKLRPSPDKWMDTGWGVLWEYERQTGKKHTVAADMLRRASASLIVSQPGFYISHLGEGWSRIWTEVPRYIVDMTDPYQTPKGIEFTPFYTHSSITGPLAKFYNAVERNLWSMPSRLALVPYIILMVASVLTYIWRRQPERVIGVWAVVGTVFYHVFIHIAANFTEFGRYRLPVQTLWMAFLCFAVVYGLAHAVLFVTTESGKSHGKTDPDPSLPSATPIPHKPMRIDAALPGAFKSEPDAKARKAKKRAR